MRRTVLATAVALALTPTAALASGHHHGLTMPEARGAIVGYAGPGTTILRQPDGSYRCKRFSRDSIGCDYKTPSSNIGLTCESEANGWVEEPCGPWESYATAYKTRLGILVGGHPVMLSRAIKQSLIAVAEGVPELYRWLGEAEALERFAVEVRDVLELAREHRVFGSDSQLDLLQKRAAELAPSTEPSRVGRPSPTPPGAGGSVGGAR